MGLASFHENLKALGEALGSMAGMPVLPWLLFLSGAGILYASHKRGVNRWVSRNLARIRHPQRESLARRIVVGDPGTCFTDTHVGIEIPVENTTKYKVGLHPRRTRILYDRTLISASVEAKPSQLGPGERGALRVMLSRGLATVDADTKAGEVKGIDVEDLKVMARISTKHGVIVEDAILVMPERTAFTLSLRDGVWRIGRILFVEGRGII